MEPTETDPTTDQVQPLELLEVLEELRDRDLIEEVVMGGAALPGSLPSSPPDQALLDDERSLKTQPAQVEPVSVCETPPAQVSLGLLAAAVAVIVWACPSLIAKALPLSSLTVVLYRSWLGVLFAFIVLRARGGRLTRTGLRLSLFGGIALALDLMLFFAAIKTTTVANATLISSMTPLLLLFLSPVVFKEKIAWPDVTAALVAMAGAVMVALASTGSVAWSLRGDIYAALCLVAWTAYLSISKHVRGKIGALEFTAGVSLIASIVVTPIALLHHDLSWPQPGHMVLLATMALFGWLGHVMMNWSLQHIPLWAGGTTVLAVPVVSTALAAVFLGEPFFPSQMVGMAIVVMALTVVASRTPEVAA